MTTNENTASDVIKAIQWSENLDQIFRDNYKNDPSLSWQFFGSSTGFMRQFPASKWKKDVPVDLYDCRLRSWYMEAATSPKDIIILMDTSGSMLGQRLDIAKHVVNTILDTLGTNDFVNILTFDKEVKPIVGCFEETLIQVYTILIFYNFNFKLLLNYFSLLKKNYNLNAASKLQKKTQPHVMLLRNTFRQIWQTFVNLKKGLKRLNPHLSPTILPL